MGGLLLSAGRLADVVEARRTFLVATAAFALTSLACGLAPTGGILIGARLLQGAAAALMTPAALALLLATYAEGPDRDRAIAYGVASAGSAPPSGCSSAGCSRRSRGGSGSSS